MALFGDTDLAEMYEIAPITTVLWYWLFISSMFFVLLNLLFSINLDHYSMLQEKSRGVTGMWPQFLSFVRDQRARAAEVGCKNWLFSACKGPDRSVPSHSLMLEEFMYRGGLGLDERQSIRQSVLGAKKVKQEREKLLFSKVADDDSVQWMIQSPAEPDLKELGVSADYVAYLVEECDAYRLREYDPKDAKVEQLRELVCMAEDDIAAMRDRLDDTQIMAKSTMKNLARRLEALERRIHCVLEELVMIAGPAGIPDKAERKVKYAKRDPAFDETVSSMRSSLKSPDSGHRQSASMKRVMKHLQTVPLHVSPKSESVATWSRAQRAVDTKGKRVVKKDGKIEFNSTIGSTFSHSL